MTEINEPLYTVIDTPSYKEMDQRYIAHTYGRQDVCFVKGEGTFLYDQKGKKYIDLGSGIGVTAFGFQDSVWLDAVTKQAAQLSHVSNLYYTQPQAILAKKLCEKTGMKKVFFSNSGAEANECAIKGARKYSSDRYGEGRNVILTLENSFHGRTITTLSATGQAVFHQHFGPFTEGFIHTPANDIEAFYQAAANDRVCAVMLEMIQGEGGVLPLCPEFVQKAAAYAKAHDLLLIVDEVQTGNGRTGTFFAWEQFGIAPDIVSTAKGLGGGLPIGATLFNEKTEAVFQPGDHGSTFGGNPICAAAAISIVDRLTDELLAEVKAKGEYLKETFADCPGVKSVAGMGLMIGIETEAPPKDCIAACLEAGVVVLSAKNKIRLLPPLVIEWDVLREAAETIKAVIAKEAERMSVK